MGGQTEMDKLNAQSAEKVQKHLENLGFDCQVVEFSSSTRTAADAAQAIGCEVAQIAKSLIFRTANTNRPILIITSGINRVDENLLATRLGEPIIKADADFIRQHTGFVIGGVPPIGHAEPIETYIDEDLLLFEEIWAAAGTPHAVFKLKPKDLMQMTGGLVINVIEE